MIEFEVNTHKYKTSKMNVMSQWAIARRIAPVVANIMTPDLLKQVVSLVPKSMTIDGSSGQPVIEMDKVLELFSGIFQPFIEAISKMSDEDSEFVINHCLAVVHRNTGGGWTAVKPQNSGLMFEDIDMLEMMQIVFRVIIDTVGNFSFASLSNLLPQGTQSA